MDTHPPFPKPHIWHQLCAAVSIFTSLLLVGVFIHGVAIPDPCSVISALILTPLPATLAIVQYFGTFRQSPTAAAWAFVATLLSTLIGLGIAVLLLLNDIRISESAVLVALTSVAATSTIALTNCHWWRKAKTERLSGLYPRQSLRLFAARIASRRVWNRVGRGSEFSARCSNQADHGTTCGRRGCPIRSAGGG